MWKLENSKIAIIGLGYVGLPLAVEFGKKFKTIGLDINRNRVSELKLGTDKTLECDVEELKSANLLGFTTELSDIAKCNIYIVTVPTPVDENKRPNLLPLQKASASLGSLLSKDDIVIYESTVYPGATEEECIPILESVSGLTFNQDFFVGYSPERINPGDKTRKLTEITKVTSGSNETTSLFVDKLYNEIINAGTHRASSIKVAEASKVIENTQRDLNIALINELAVIFNKLEIDTTEVLEAAGTKWNFLPFRPGLVGGHCIGVDPYYLCHKAQSVGYMPDVILSGRRINDGMGEYIATRLIKAMIQKGINLPNSRILIMGYSFKENCPDTRNTKVSDIVREIQSYHVSTDVLDPWVKTIDDPSISLITEPSVGVYDAIIIAVGHDEFVSMGADKIKQLAKDNHVIFDVKCIFPKSCSDIRL